MTLNGVIAFILLFSPNLIALQAYLITVVEDRPVADLRGAEPAPAPPLDDGPTPSKYS